MATLADVYKTGVSQPQLNEGVYKVKLLSHRLVETNPDNPYIALEFETETGRVLKENRFNQGFQIMISHLKKQLERADETISYIDFLNQLVEEATEFNIWITKYTPAKGQSRANFNFLEPRKIEDDGGVTVAEVEDAI